MICSMSSRTSAATYPVRELRWTVLHLYDVSEDSLKRMKSLGLIWGVQDGLYFGGERLQKEVGAEAAKQMPRIATALQARADGCRRHRRAPGVVLQSRSCRCNGISTAPPSAVCRRAAMRKPPAGARRWRCTPAIRRSWPMTTTNAARWSRANSPTSRCCPSDYLTAPVNEIGKIRSVLTMVGGEAVYAERAVCGTSRPASAMRIGGAVNDQHAPNATGRKACSNCWSSLPPIASIIANALRVGERQPVGALLHQRRIDIHDRGQAHDVADLVAAEAVRISGCRRAARDGASTTSSISAGNPPWAASAS